MQYIFLLESLFNANSIPRVIVAGRVCGTTAASKSNARIRISAIDAYLVKLERKVEDKDISKHHPTNGKYVHRISHSEHRY